MNNFKSILITVCLIVVSCSATSANALKSDNANTICSIMSAMYIAGASTKCSGIEENEALDMFHDIGDKVARDNNLNAELTALAHKYAIEGVKQAYRQEHACDNMEAIRQQARDCWKRCLIKLTDPGIVIKLH